MSLYAFEGSVGYRIIFTLFYIVMVILFGLAILTIYRSRYLPKEKAYQKMNMIRYIVAWCLLLQLLTFIGYDTGSVSLFATIWNLWIPSWTAGYVILSKTIAITHSSNSNFTKSDRKRERIKWILLWSGCSLAEWAASFCGWVLGFYQAQAVGYLLWKLIAFIMLMLLVMMLYRVQNRIKNLLKTVPKSENNKHDEFNTDELIRGYQRIKHLVIIELILSLYLFISVVYESYVVISIFSGDVVNSIYVTEATVMKLVVYFPLWSLINTVLLVYGWVPRGAMITNNELQLSQTAQSNTSNTNATSNESTAKTNKPSKSDETATKVVDVVTL